MTHRKILSLVIALILVVSAFAMADEPQKPVIGIVQLIQHVSLDAAHDGFIEGLTDSGYTIGEDVIIDDRNAQGSQDNLAMIGDVFVSRPVDMILAIATPSAQAMATKTATIPILGTAITDYVTARLADSNEKPGYNVSGTTDMNPIKEQIELLHRIAPQAATIGLIYTSSEDNSVLQAKTAKEAIEALGLKWAEVTVANSNDVQQATISLAGKCDAIYIPTDNVLASAMPLVAEIAVANKLPVVCGASGMVAEGGMATLAIDYHKLGYQTGKMAARLLKGEDVSTMPIEAQTSFEYAVNKELCDAIGLEIPADLLPYVMDKAAR